MALFSRFQRSLSVSGFAAQALEFAFEPGAGAPWRRRRFRVERLALDFELRDRARSSLSISIGMESIWMRERCAGFVDEVDGLVGQEAVGDVAVREDGGGDDGGVLDAHAVVDFVTSL